VSLNYNYVDGNGHNNGNVMSITNVIDSTRTQNFTYDYLNRLSTAQTASTHATSPTNCWAETYTYDAVGNLLSLGPNTTNQSPYIGCVQESGFTNAMTGNNQISGFCYDASGNLLKQGAAPCPSPTYVYNAENQLTSTAGVTYTYDGDGKRVMKSSGMIYWYGTNSDPLVETDLSNNFLAAYLFLNGKRVGRHLPTNEVDLYFADALGSSRFVNSLAGWNVSDFYPFGGERVIYTGTLNHYKFTGKERDSESGLDNFGARYDSSQYGRFMSPDPGNAGADPTNPQSWNMYSYVLNNPLSNTDPSGLCSKGDDDRMHDDADGPCVEPKGTSVTVTAKAEDQETTSIYFPHGSSSPPTPPGRLPLPRTPLTQLQSLLQPANPCTLVPPSGEYNVGPRANPVFQPQVADSLGKAFENMNNQGIVPMITSGFRNGADQQRMLNGASGSNPAAIQSLHQTGEAVDLNSRDPNFPTIRQDMTNQGFNWGGNFSQPDPVHFQLAPPGTKPDPAMIQACGGG
jgi:RHS repeat-associated protein